jgi:transcriptional regulator with XRE-family HTH domain
MSLQCQSIMPRLLSDRDFRAAWNYEQMNVGLRLKIRATRIARGWSQETLALESGKPQSVISRIERLTPRCNVTVQTLLDVASALDVGLLVQFSSWPDAVANSLDVTKPVTPVQSITESLAA